MLPDHAKASNMLLLCPPDRLLPPWPPLQFMCVYHLPWASSQAWTSTVHATAICFLSPWQAAAVASMLSNFEVQDHHHARLLKHTACHQSLCRNKMLLTSLAATAPQCWLSPSNLWCWSTCSCSCHGLPVVDCCFFTFVIIVLPITGRMMIAFFLTVTSCCMMANKSCKNWSLVYSVITRCTHSHIIKALGKGLQYCH